MNQNLPGYIINLPTKKWQWLLSQFVPDVTVNHAYLKYSQSHLNPGVYELNALSFCRGVVDAYYHLYRKSLSSVTLFTGSHSLHHPVNNLQVDSINHRIAKGSQRRCSLPQCKETSVDYCKKCNVGLHAGYFELYYCKQNSLYSVLKIDKRKFYTKKGFTFTFLSVFIFLPIERQI